jgi:hypothetical protein
MASWGQSGLLIHHITGQGTEEGGEEEEWKGGEGGKENRRGHKVSP